MRQDKYEIARNAIIHAGLLLNVANRALSDETPSSEQDNELTADVYKLARDCEALNDTLRMADQIRREATRSKGQIMPRGSELDDAEGQGRR